MELAFIQLPMAVFTTLAPMASGAFIGLAIAFITTRFSRDRLERIDRWTVLPLGILAVAYVAAFAFFASPQHAIGAFQGIGTGAVSAVGVAGMLFVALAAVYWIIAMTGNLPERPRAVFATVVGAASLVFSLVIGASYMASAVTSWSSAVVPIGIMGFCAAGGVPLGALVVALGGGLPEARRTRFAPAALIAAFIGVAASIFAVSAQLLYAQSVFSAFFPGAEALPGSWVYLVISIVGFVAMLACLRATVMPGGRGSAVPLGRTAGAAAAVPQRDRADARPIGIRSAVPLLVAGNVAVIVAIFVARLMFYALQV